MANKKYVEIKENKIGEKDYLEFIEANSVDKDMYIELEGNKYTLDMDSNNRSLIDYQSVEQVNNILRETGNIIITKNGMNLKIKSKLYRKIKKEIPNNIQYNILIERVYSDVDGETTVIKRTEKNKNFQPTYQTLIDDLISILYYIKDLKKSISEEDSAQSVKVKAQIKNKSIQSLYDTIKSAYKKANK